MTSRSESASGFKQGHVFTEEGGRVRMHFPSAANVLCSLENEIIKRQSGDVARSTRDTTKTREAPIIDAYNTIFRVRLGAKADKLLLQAREHKHAECRRSRYVRDTTSGYIISTTKACYVLKSISLNHMPQSDRQNAYLPQKSSKQMQGRTNACSY